jgi:preprotein translocase subunit Sec63
MMLLFFIIIILVVVICVGVQLVFGIVYIIGKALIWAFGWVVNNLLIIGVICIAAYMAIGFIVGMMESRLKKKLQRQERERQDREREDLQRREQAERQRQDREHQDSWSRNDRPAPNTERRDPYVILGVRRGATLEEIHVIYRGLAKVLHPDKGGAVDPERMRDLNWAMDTIRQDFGE